MSDRGKSLVRQLEEVSRYPMPGSDSSARLALDLAMRVKTADVVAESYGLTRGDLLHRLRTDKQFAMQVKAYKEVWHNPMNAVERTRIKAAVLAEDGLVDVWRLFLDTDVHPSIRLDSYKHICKLGDVEPKAVGADGGGGTRFSVTINLPNCDPMEVVAAIDVEADEMEEIS